MRRDLVLALLFLVVAAAFRLPRLAIPEEEIFDEVYHAATALQYLQGQEPKEWVHPPTAKLLIAVGVHQFGYNSWAWRLAPALAGILLAPVFFLFARRVLATERAAILATVILLCDGVYLVQSRIAMTNIFAVLFQVSAALFIVRAVLRDPLPVEDMLLAGLALGLALSTRWTSLWATGYLGLVMLVVRGRRFWTLRELSLVALAFLIIPVALYDLSYLPWRQMGHSQMDMIQKQRDIWGYHAHLNATHPYFSKWYTWPWLYRPTWYYFKQFGNKVSGIFAVGNPALWWVSVPISLWAVVSGAQARDPRRLFAGVGFGALYLPWGISPRTLNYSHYLFEAIPYACLSLGILLDRLWNGPWGGVARGYLALTILLFLFFYPMLAAIPIPQDWYFKPLFDGVKAWTWFPTWI